MLPSSLHPRVPDYRDVSLPLRMDGTRPRARTAPPSSGQDTTDVLRELGYDDEEIERLMADGVVAGPGE